MVDIKKMNKLKYNFIVQKLEEYGTFDNLYNYIFLMISSNVLDDSLLFLGSLLYIYPTLKSLIDFDKSEKENYELLTTISIEDDDDYKRLKEIYDEYVKRIAKYLNDIGFDDPLDIGINFSIMLHRGMLSKTNSFEYKIVRHDNDSYYPKVLGARVSSGFGVCRNMAALLSDVYNELGYDANYLVVRLHKNIPGYAHAVCFVSSDSGSFIVDPTWKAAASVDDSYTKTGEIIGFDGLKNRCTDYFLGYYDNDGNYNSITPDFFINKKCNRIIDSNDLIIRYKKLLRFNNFLSFYDEDGNIQELFNDKNKELINEISSAEQALTMPKIKVKKGIN